MTDPSRPRRAWEAIRAADWSKPAEWLVLAAVLAIAALISYTHLRFVWEKLGAPWPYLGPLSVDGLFAAAWLRMRRRRNDGVEVGSLAWVAMVVAFVATLGGNVAAAFPAWLDAHRDLVAPLVYAWPAVAFGLVWELVTGHARRVAQVTETVTPAAPPTVTPTVEAAAEKPAPKPRPAPGTERTEAQREADRIRAARSREKKRLAASPSPEVAA